MSAEQTPSVEEALGGVGGRRVRPQRLRLSGVETLTPSERRVAECAAAGASIARSPKGCS